VADTANNRILVYDSIINAPTDVTPAFTLVGVTRPFSVFVSPQTGEIWASDTGSGWARRYPSFINLLLFGDLRPNLSVPMAPLSNSLRAAVGVTQDSFGALYVTDGANRVAIYYPGLNVINGGNQFRRYAPGGYAKLLPVTNAKFGDSTVNSKDV